MTNPFQDAAATVSGNPFTQADGGSLPAGMENPFLQPTSNIKFPKFEQLFGRLIILMPRKLEVVPKYKKPEETEERMTADLVVLDGGPLNDDDNLPLQFDGMWINQQSIVGSLKGCLQKGAPTLGRAYRFPTKDSAADYPTRQAIEAGLNEHFASRGASPKPAFTWRLEQYTQDELAIAMQWFKEHPNFF